MCTVMLLQGVVEPPVIRLSACCHGNSLRTALWDVQQVSFHSMSRRLTLDALSPWARQWRFHCSSTHKRWSSCCSVGLFTFYRSWFYSPCSTLNFLFIHFELKLHLLQARSYCCKQWRFYKIGLFFEYHVFLRFVLLLNVSWPQIFPFPQHK